MRRFQIAGKNVLLVKHQTDDRYSKDNVSTHDGVAHPAINASHLWDLDTDLLEKCDVIGIDEGQFFPDLVSFVDCMARRGKTIVIAALDGTFQRKIFPAIAEVIPLCDAIHKFRAVCRDCGKDAPFTHIKKQPTTECTQIIGGNELYEALCRNCWCNRNE
jgi:thymidine kinase